MKRSTILLLLVTAGGCASRPGTYTPTPPPKVEPLSGPVTKAEEVLPLAVGNTWTYELQSGPKAETRTASSGCTSRKRFSTPSPARRSSGSPVSTASS